MLNRLNEIIDQLLKQANRLERSQKIYDSPSWAYKQAHFNGYTQAMTQIKDLITDVAI